MHRGLSIAFFGSSLVSAFWNGAATYYRGIIRTLANRGHHITFYEPDAFDRQKHRDIPDPEWAGLVVYDPNDGVSLDRLLTEASKSDVVVKASGVGVLDDELETAIVALKRPRQIIIFWDVDAPATLQRLADAPQDRLRTLIPRFDLVLTYGGGDPVVAAYRRFGARRCVPIYNALDPSTHFPVDRDERFAADLALLANRLPDREKRIQEFFFNTSVATPAHSFVLAGNGWADKPMPSNVRYLGHLYTHQHNAFNSSALAVLNVSRDSMARNGFSPATRVFEAAGSGACIISDAWQGIELFLEPASEILVARDGAEVMEHLRSLTPERARRIGDAARRRVLGEHTYALRAQLVEDVLEGRA